MTITSLYQRISSISKSSLLALAMQQLLMKTRITQSDFIDIQTYATLTCLCPKQVITKMSKYQWSLAQEIISTPTVGQWKQPCGALSIEKQILSEEVTIQPSTVGWDLLSIGVIQMKPLLRMDSNKRKSAHQDKNKTSIFNQRFYH